MQIKTIPFNKPFLPSLAKYIAKKHADKVPDFSSILVVFPSERNKVYFREYLLKEIKKDGMIPPNLFTIGQLYEHIFEKMACLSATASMAGGPEEIERNVLLREAVQDIKAKHLKDLPFIKFISMGRKLLGLFDELTSWNTSVREIEKMKNKLHFPAQYIEEELPILKKIYNKYIENLNKRRLIDTSLSHLSIAEDFKDEYLKEFGSVYIAGMLALTFTDISLIKKILKNLPAELILHSDKGELKDDSLDNIFYHHNKILKLLGIDSGKVKSISPGKVREQKPTEVYIQKCKSMLDEVSFIINSISVASQRYPLHRIGVTLPEESFYLPLADALAKYGVPYNLSMGIPFKHSPLYSFLKDIYELIDSDFKADRFLILLKNQILKGIKKKNVLFSELSCELDRKIRNANFPRIGRKIKDSQSQPVIDYIFMVTDRLKSNIAFGEYVKALRKIIQELAGLNNDFYERNAQNLNGLMDKLIAIENSLVPDEFCPEGKDKLRFLINILEGISFPVSGDFSSGIQVIGILESRNIDFDCIIIPSCNEGIFPKESEKDLFLPANLRKEAGLPYYKERDALYSYYFHQLITGKREVYLSYRSRENTELGLRNRWIEKLVDPEPIRHRSNGGRFRVKENNTVNFTNPIRNLFLNGVAGKARKEIKPSGVSKDSRTLNILKSFIFSPSHLKTYKQCGYKFYLSYILKLKEPKHIQEEYDASKWGIILHNAFARLYGEVYREGYTPNMRKKVNKKLLEIGREEFLKAYPAPKASLRFGWDLTKKRLASFVDSEIGHFKEGFKPIRLESELKPYTIKIDKFNIKLGGIADRIDAKPATETKAGRDDKFYIIDYKISKRPAAKTYRIPATPATKTLAGRKDLAGRGKDFTEFQLPLYALIFTRGDIEKIGGLIYYHLDDTRQKFLMMDILQKEGKDYIEKFRKEILIPVFKDMFEQKTNFNLTKDFDACQRCMFVDHCGRRV